jgi:hypothetical protein
MSDLNLEPTYMETVTPEEYLEILDKMSGEIESVTVVPSRLGAEEFGMIRIFYKSPVYQVGLNRE